MRQTRLLIPFLLVVVAACSTPVGGQGGPATGGRHYELSITHRLDAAAFGGQTLTWTESDFHSVDDGEHYLMTLEASGRRVELQSLTGRATLAGHVEPSLAGPADVDTDESTTYVLDEGAFAGGRLVVWNDKGRLRAELTIQGSGRPVISSERGDLDLVA